MLSISADQVFTVGIVSGVLQPVVVNGSLRNVPERGLFNWDPGAFFGMEGHPQARPDPPLSIPHSTLHDGPASLS
jgi:hypothetical protein